MFTYLFNPDKGESFILSCLPQIWACLERGFLIHIPVPFFYENPTSWTSPERSWGGGGGALPYISHTGMCRPKRYCFCAVSVWKGYRFCSYWSGIGYGFWGNYESVNRAAHPDKKFPGMPPLGNFCHRCLNVGFFYNQSQSTMDASVSAEGRIHERRSSWSLCSFGYGLKELFRA